MEKAGEAGGGRRERVLQAGGSRRRQSRGCRWRWDETLVPGGCDGTGPGRVADQTPFQPGNTGITAVTTKATLLGGGSEAPFLLMTQHSCAMAFLSSPHPHTHSDSPVLTPFLQARFSPFPFGNAQHSEKDLFACF